jgi:hypothetical protein
MYKQVRILIALAFVLTLAGTALAQEPPPWTEHTDPTWKASYWNNTTLSGTPALERDETSLDHDWGTSSPDSSVNADHFSARWTKYIDVSAGTYRFSATSDDGIRVYVDNDLIIDQWNDHSATTFDADKYLIAGHHWTVVEFYERAGQAVAKLSWAPTSSPQPTPTPTPGPTTNWRGEYFNNTTLSGSSALVRDDAAINFDWGSGSPASGVNADEFSVRWTQDLDLPAAHYRFTATVDDGVRLWVNNHLLIESWRDQATTTYTGDIFLPGGKIPVKMEYYENQGFAVARLSWAEVGDSQPTPSPGTVVVDDTDSGFVKGGSASGWRTAYEGYGGRLTWTRNNDWARSNYNWARWYPSLSAGRYEVYVFIPYRYTTTSNARYWVSHSGGYTLRVVNQSTNGDRWVSLGTYWFDGGSDEYVSLSDVTYEPRVTRLIAFDAVKWVPR